VMNLLVMEMVEVTKGDRDMLMVPITYTPLLLCKPFWSSKTQPFSYSSCRNTPFSDKKILY